MTSEISSPLEGAEPVAPAWFVLVPVEPTPEMLRAAVRCRYGDATYKVSLATVEEQEAADEYRAMVAAAPSHPPALEALKRAMREVRQDAAGRAACEAAIAALSVQAGEVPAGVDDLRKALHDAATSLETISSLAGRKTYGDPPIETYMDTFMDVRLFAASRARVAREALAAMRATKEGN